MQIEGNFLVQIGKYCVHEYKIRFCKNFTLPLPQIRYF